MTPGTNLCPNCGADTRPLWTEPEGFGLVQLEMPDFAARQRGDQWSKTWGTLLGFLIGIFTGPLGLIIDFIIWLCTQRSNPYFARGIKSGALGAIVVYGLVFLGAFILCSGMGH
jgi:hypothetical protein